MRWVSCQVCQTKLEIRQTFKSEQLVDEYFIVKPSQNIKGRKFQCPEVRQKSSKKHKAENLSSPDRGFRGQVTKKSNQYVDFVIKHPETPGKCAYAGS